jgi:hypothetical protein
MTDQPDQDSYSPEEAARRSDDVLRHMLSRPPQPHATRPPARPKTQKSTDAGRAKKASDRREKP